MVPNESTVRLAEGIGRLARAIRSSAHRREKAMGMRPADMVVLRWLAIRDEVRSGDIADYLGLNASAISRQLTVMEAEQLITRRVDPDDGRAGLVSLSDKGADRLAEVNRTYADYLDGLVGDWSDAKLGRAADILCEVAEALTSDCNRTRT